MSRPIEIVPFFGETPLPVDGTTAGLSRQEGNPRGRSHWRQVVLGTLALAGLPMIGACSPVSSKPLENTYASTAISSPTPEPRITPVSVGSDFNPRLPWVKEVYEKLSDPNQRDNVPNNDIKDFNTFMEAEAKRALAAVTPTPVPPIATLPSREGQGGGLPPTPVPPTATSGPATATPARNEVSTQSVEKSPLPRYAAFMGDLLNPQTKAVEGVIMIAAIPTNEGEKILVYYFNNNRLYRAFEGEGKNVQNKAFQIHNFEPFQIRSATGQIETKRVETETIQATLDPTDEFLEGKLTAGPGPISAPDEKWTTVFRLKLQPSGEKARVISTAQKVKNKGLELNSPDPGNIAIKELEKLININNWLN